MFSCVDKYFKKEVQTPGNDSWLTMNMGGINQYGEPFGTMLSDVGAGGEGPWPHRDGAAAHFLIGIPTMQITDVELNENVYPMLYLYRRIIPNSQGAGKYKSGEPAGMAFKLHDVDSVFAALIGQGVQAPQRGMFGGTPGACPCFIIKRKTDIDEKLAEGKLPHDIDELNGEETVYNSKPGGVTFSKGEVLKSTFQTSGGYGDPLERDPRHVFQDITWGRLSPEWANKMYGVVIDPQKMEVNKVATEQKRKRILSERVSLAKNTQRVPQIDPAKATRLMPMGEYLEVIEAGGTKLIKCRCGYQFGPITQNWKDHATRVGIDPKDIGPFVTPHKDIEIRGYWCPNCGLQLDVEVAQKGDPPLWDIALDI